MTTLRMLSWSGYTDILASYTAELEDLGLRILVHEDGNADAIYSRFIGGGNYYDVVVVDWEYRHRYESLVITLPDELVRLSQYLEPFKDRYWYELSSQLSFVPLRFGTNGVITRNGTGSQQPSVNTFIAGRDAASQLGVWNWWLPNLLLLAKAAGFRSPHTITESQLREVSEGILRDFSNRIRSIDRRNRHLFGSLGDIIDHELSSGVSKPSVDWILGPSEMVVAPISSAKAARNEVNHLRWDIPEEGGLVWLETAALSESLMNDSEKKSAAFRFLTFLQSDKVQIALICGQREPSGSSPKTYWSYPLNNVDAIRKVPKSIRASFKNPPFEESALEFGRWVATNLESRALIMRALPDEYERWQEAWDGALNVMGWA